MLWLSCLISATPMYVCVEFADSLYASGVSSGYSTVLPTVQRQAL